MKKFITNLIAQKKMDKDSDNNLHKIFRYWKKEKKFQL